MSTQLPLLQGIPAADPLPLVHVADLLPGWCDWPFEPCPSCGGRICYDSATAPTIAACVDCRRVFNLWERGEDMMFKGERIEDPVPVPPAVMMLTEEAAGALIYRTDYAEDP